MIWLGNKLDYTQKNYMHNWLQDMQIRHHTKEILKLKLEYKFGINDSFAQTRPHFS